MRYPTSEKLEIIRIVEQSHLPARRMLDQLGIARRTFYRWYDRYLEGGPEALQDRPSAPSRVWNRIGEDIQQQIVDIALEHSELSPRELAVRFVTEQARPVQHVGMAAACGCQSHVERIGDIAGAHGRAQPPGDDVARVRTSKCLPFQPNVARADRHRCHSPHQYRA
jgi:transposase-like protein